GLINGLDRVRDDRSDIPTFTGGLGLSLKYKNVYAAVLIQGAAGAVRYYEPTKSGAIGNFFLKDAEGRWTPENPNASKPRTWNGSGEYYTQQPNTYWLQSTDYARLKTVEIGYNLPNKVTDKIGIRGASIYFSGLNLLTLDRLDGFDPETISRTAYPPNKVFNFGLTVTL
ncbi:MAG TPA: SusC/RagA family TonB-linked outer membrane protein, partial [Agriterribacter sp.]|nr:SusC/RagA family TonB-linked outer membrane protein [Agriterribacter sp.]